MQFSESPSDQLVDGADEIVPVTVIGNIYNLNQVNIVCFSLYLNKIAENSINIKY